MENSNTDALFRREALDARRDEWLGTITLATPPSRYLLTVATLLVVAALAALLCFGSYTRRERIFGTLVPSTSDDGAALSARFLVPSRAIGFMTVGDPVLLRYHAYPYQKFGLHSGIIATISNRALTPRQLADTGFGAAAEPVFVVDVALSNQTVRVYDRTLPLRADLAVDADVMLDRRRLIEWLFEPLNGLRQRHARAAHE